MDKPSLCIVVVLLASVGCGGGAADLSTPEGTLAELKRAVNEGDWRAHFRLHTKESVPNLTTGFLLEFPGKPELQEKLRPIREKHLLPIDPDSPPKDLHAAMTGLADRIDDPEAFYVEACAVLADEGGMRHEILDFEDREVTGDTATARKVVRYAGADVARTTGLADVTFPEPVRLERVDGRWLIQMAR